MTSIKPWRGPRAIWVGHDWGAPLVWALAHHPERCHGATSLCVRYLPDGFAAEHAIALANRTIYSEDYFPASQWDYQLFYHENIDAASAGYEKNVRATLRGFFRAGHEHAGTPLFQRGHDARPIRLVCPCSERLPVLDEALESRTRRSRGRQSRERFSTSRL